MHSKIIGLSIGAGAGALLGGYAAFPLWRNRQTYFTPAMVTWLPYAWAVGFGLVGAGIGLLVARRVSRDARETRKPTKRERNDVYYADGLSDVGSKRHVIVYLENSSKPENMSSYLLVFPKSETGEIGIRAWSPSEGHTSVSREYLRTLKVAKGLMASTVLKAYTRQYDDGTSFELVTSWPRTTRMSDADCTPKRRKKRSGPKMSRRTKTVRLGNKTVRVTVLSDGTYTPTITADHPAVLSFIQTHPRLEKEIVLMAADTAASRHGVSALTPEKIHDAYGALRLPFSIFMSLGKDVLRKQTGMSKEDADAFEAMVQWSEQQSKSIR